MIEALEDELRLCFLGTSIKGLETAFGENRGSVGTTACYPFYVSRGDAKEYFSFRVLFADAFIL